MPKVTILKGLPASGKSTWAKEQVLASNGQIKRVNKDDLREMLDIGKWSGKNEAFVLNVRDTIINGAIINGYDVIIDDTNLNPAHENGIKELVKNIATVEINDSFISVPLDECIRRDSTRTKPVGRKVIKSMYHKYLAPKYTPPEHDPAKETIIMCDIDGTVAKMNGRSPYDLTKVSTDVPHVPVVELVKTLKEKNQIVFLSGRDGSCFAETHAWIKEHVMDNTEFKLFMRPAGNSEKDNIIKQRLYEEYIKQTYNVKFVLDDRDRVVDMWRAIGLTCFQVEDGDF